VSCATLCTNPLDVLKVRLQVMAPEVRPAAGPRETPVGMVGTFVHLVRREGPAALWKGLAPSLVRALCYGGLRLGLYQPIVAGIESQRSHGEGGGSGDSAGRSTGVHYEQTDRGSGGAGGYADGKEGGRGAPSTQTDMTTKIAAGCASGAFAAALLNPTELLKTRLMADARTAAAGTAQGSAAAASGGLAAATHHVAPCGTASTLAAIVRHEGIGGLWKGAGMSMTRSAVLTASQCATYDEVKRALVAATGASDGLGTHLCASMLTGLVTTTVTNPVDMIKTQMYMDTRGAGSPGFRAMGGAFGAMQLVLARHGPAGLMRGWGANYLRLGPQTVITFVALEKLRAAAGLSAL